jgi:hypothetical protein
MTQPRSHSICSIGGPSDSGCVQISLSETLLRVRHTYIRQPYGRTVRSAQYDRRYGDSGSNRTMKIKYYNF